MIQSTPIDPLLTAVVETILKPMVVADGGTIRIKESSPDAVTIELGGACLGCPGRAFTIQQVIIPVLQRAGHSQKNITVVDRRDTE